MKSIHPIKVFTRFPGETVSRIVWLLHNSQHVVAATGGRGGLVAGSFSTGGDSARLAGRVDRREGAGRDVRGTGRPGPVQDKEG